MNTLAVLLIGVGIILIGVGIYFIYIHYTKPRGNQEYLWAGSGDHPFR